MWIWKIYEIKICSNKFISIWCCETFNMVGKNFEQNFNPDRSALSTCTKFVEFMHIKFFSSNLSNIKSSSNYQMMFKFSNHVQNSYKNVL